MTSLPHGDASRRHVGLDDGDDPVTRCAAVMQIARLTAIVADAVEVGDMDAARRALGASVAATNAYEADTGMAAGFIDRRD
jgi:hypothetical protein